MQEYSLCVGDKEGAAVDPYLPLLMPVTSSDTGYRNVPDLAP